MSENENRLLLNQLDGLRVDDNSELLIVGDLNLPDVNWHSGRVLASNDTGNKRLLNQNNYMDIIIHKGLVWHITDQITRRRMVNGVLQESTLDQVLTSNAELVESIVMCSPIGHSDHVTITVKDL